MTFFLSRLFVSLLLSPLMPLQISCPTNTPIEVNGGASLEMTSAEASTKLNNVKIWVRDGTFLCTVPMLDWTSVETVEVRHPRSLRFLFQEQQLLVLGGRNERLPLPDGVRVRRRDSLFSKTWKICPHYMCATLVRKYAG